MHALVLLRGEVVGHPLEILRGLYHGVLPLITASHNQEQGNPQAGTHHRPHALLNFFSLSRPAGKGRGEGLTGCDVAARPLTLLHLSPCTFHLPLQLPYASISSANSAQAV